MITASFRKIFICISASVFILTACLRDPDPLPEAFDVIQGNSNYSTFIEAAKIAEFDDDFQLGTSLTYFVPDNDAFAAFLDSMGYSSINDVAQSDLQDLLRYHLIQGAARISDLGTNYYLTPAGVGPGQEAVAIMIETLNGVTRINNYAKVIRPDDEAHNSFIHGIDKVLRIPNTIDFIKANTEFSEFFTGVQRAGLENLLKGSNPHTILAPPNQAFEVNLPKLFQVDHVADMDQNDVDSLFRYHILKDNISSEDFFNSSTYNHETYLPNRDVWVVDFGGGYVINDTILFLLSDIQARNGVIHIVDHVLHYE